MATRLERLEPAAADHQRLQDLPSWPTCHQPWGGDPSQDEIAEVMTFIVRQANLLPSSAKRSNTRGRSKFGGSLTSVMVLLNSNEFLYVDKKNKKNTKKKKKKKKKKKI